MRRQKEVEDKEGSSFVLLQEAFTCRDELIVAKSDGEFLSFNNILRNLMGHVVM